MKPAKVLQEEAQQQQPQGQQHTVNKQPQQQPAKQQQLQQLPLVVKQQQHRQLPETLRQQQQFQKHQYLLKPPPSHLAVQQQQQQVGHHHHLAPPVQQPDLIDVFCHEQQQACPEQQQHQQKAPQLLYPFPAEEKSECLFAAEQVGEQQQHGRRNDVARQAATATLAAERHTAPEKETHREGTTQLLLHPGQNVVLGECLNVRGPAVSENAVGWETALLASTRSSPSLSSLEAALVDQHNSRVSPGTLLQPRLSVVEQQLQRPPYPRLLYARDSSASTAHTHQWRPRRCHSSGNLRSIKAVAAAAGPGFAAVLTSCSTAAAARPAAVKWKGATGGGAGGGPRGGTGGSVLSGVAAAAAEATLASVRAAAILDGARNRLLQERQVEEEGGNTERGNLLHSKSLCVFYEVSPALMYSEGRQEPHAAAADKRGAHAAAAEERDEKAAAAAIAAARNAGIRESREVEKKAATATAEGKLAGAAEDAERVKAGALSISIHIPAISEQHPLSISPLTTQTLQTKAGVVSRGKSEHVVAAVADADASLQETYAARNAAGDAGLACRDAAAAEAAAVAATADEEQEKRSFLLSEVKEEDDDTTTMTPPSSLPSSGATYDNCSVGGTSLPSFGTTPSSSLTLPSDAGASLFAAAGSPNSAAASLAGSANTIPAAAENDLTFPTGKSPTAVLAATPAAEALAIAPAAFAVETAALPCSCVAVAATLSPSAAAAATSPSAVDISTLATVASMPCVLVIITGGTICMDYGGEKASMRPQRLAQRLQQIPELRDASVPSFDVLEWENLVDSSDVGVAHWRCLALQIQQFYDNYDGFVVLHGTDTMAYTAAALSFMLENLAKPVVLTGAMLPMLHISTDAKRNLVASMLIAGCSELREVAIVFGAYILRGSRATKMDCSGFDAFFSPNCAPIGTVGVDIIINEEVLLLRQYSAAAALVAAAKPLALACEASAAAAPTSPAAFPLSLQSAPAVPPSAGMTAAAVFDQALPSSAIVSETETRSAPFAAQSVAAASSVPAAAGITVAISPGVEEGAEREEEEEGRITAGAEGGSNSLSVFCKMAQNIVALPLTPFLPVKALQQLLLSAPSKPQQDKKKKEKSYDSSSRQRHQFLQPPQQLVTLGEAAAGEEAPPTEEAAMGESSAEETAEKQPLSVILLLYGSGTAPGSPELLDFLRTSIKEGINVVILTQCRRGSSNLLAYENGVKLHNLGVINGKDMTLEACVAKLSYLTGKGYRGKELKELMETDLRGEITETRNKVGVNHGKSAALATVANRGGALQLLNAKAEVLQGKCCGSCSNSSSSNLLEESTSTVATPSCSIVDRSAATSRKPSCGKESTGSPVVKDAAQCKHSPTAAAGLCSYQ